MSETMTLPRRNVAVAVALGAIAAATESFAQGAKPGPEIEALKALLDAHDKAFTAHDEKGVLALFAPTRPSSVLDRVRSGAVTRKSPPPTRTSSRTSTPANRRRSPCFVMAT